MSSVTFCQTQNSNGNNYIVYKASNRENALVFLRKQKVIEERHYIIVETPEGNFGKDFIAIFNEKTQEVIEFGKRQPLPKLKKSMTQCTRCGYPVLPAGKKLIESAVEMLLIDDLKNQGVGFLCERCKTLWCPFCVSFYGDDVVCQICGWQMKLFGR